ncbi:MAG TPA: 3-hydroxyacyl-CoA dehydrogenase NAD-binding domain-containing protein [Candidatus Limnocylindrales bacterium]|nr:3-hydroxyacyl-CoA dehydrogenase NAD-binding domain-containing protein [Candidatus Limnocylindrales bacterium]
MDDVRTERNDSTGPGLPIIGIVGAGVMGAGIAQLALEAGHEVVLHDVDETAIARGRDRIADGLARRATRTLADPDSIDDWVDGRVARLRETTVVEQLGDEADVVIEAALELLELKQTIFRALDAVADPATILATNTSALSIAAIAGATTHPERVLGLHFFNPAPVMRLVEVVAGPETDEGVVDRAIELVASWGRTPVRSADRPGFIVNRVNRPFTIEALRIVEEGSASVESVDEAMREGGYPLGPFELMDLTGIDVTHAAATAIWDGLGRPDHLRPSPLQEERIAAGALGRKTGEGFHRYEGGKRIGPAERYDRDAATLGPDAIRRRIEAAIAAEARRAVADGVASEANIDRALRLGAGHPHGVFGTDGAEA